MNSCIAFALLIALAGCTSSTPPPTVVAATSKTKDKASRVEEPDLTKLEAEVSPKRVTEVSCDVDGDGPARKDGFIWPVDGVVISAYGKREGLPHEGIDIAAPTGTPIRATSAGTVLFAGEQPGYGRIVIVRHQNELVTIYAHNAENCVEDGDDVAQGDVLAVVGQSGDASSPSVHFEVRVGQKTVNPRKHLSD